jgi:chemotaxis protein MotB
LFDKNEPQNPINRRISIVVMTKQAEEAALKTDVASETPAPAPTAAPATSGQPAPGSSASTTAAPAVAAAANPPIG